MLQGRLDNYVDIGLIVTDPALERGKWIGSGVLELWEDSDISLEAQVKLQKNLIWYFSFFQPSPLEVLSECHLKNVVLTLSQQDRKGAEPSDSPCLGAHFEHCQWPAGGTLVPCSLHSLSKSELNCVKVMLTTAAEIPWRLALLFLVKFRSTTEEHLETWDVRNGVISLGRQSLGQGEEDSIDSIQAVAAEHNYPGTRF